MRRFRAKASRRPVLFWWQAFAILGITIFLWSGLPVSAVFYSPRKFAPLPSPRASYVVLEPSEALKMLRKARSDWMGGDGGVLSPAFAIDLGLDELRDKLPPPSFMEQGSSFSEGWRPAAVEPLSLRLSEVPVPSVICKVNEPERLDSLSGVRLLPDSSLSDSAFKADLELLEMPGREGHARFYVETGIDGSVEHVLAIPPLTTGGAVIERALLRGKAKGAARGFVEVYWKAAR
ncbi:MAG: hypothetical protein PHU80_00670 [Kiritimatiellae bacterium]|nr:hypothetical protein [Kiritimatiellia bacterium]